MSLAATLLLAAAAAHGAPADAPKDADRGAQVATARVSVTILRPAVLRSGTLVTSNNAESARSQRHSEQGRVTYLFE